MPVESDFPEFPHEEPPHGITCQQMPWNGVLVVADGLPFKAGDKVTFDVIVCRDLNGQAVAAEHRGAVSLTADTTSVGYTIPWTGVLDTVVEGSIMATYTHTPGDGSGSVRSEAALVGYSRQLPNGAARGPSA